MSIWKVAFIAVAVLCAVPSASTGAVIHVPTDQPTIQAGIDAAEPGDTVEVACGTYYEHGIVMMTGVYLTSETGLPDCVSIDAQELGRVIYCDNIDSSASIVGFTLTGGRTLGGENEGGGLYCIESSPELRNIVFQDNWAEWSGGGMSAQWGAPTLTDVIFTGNWADAGGGGLSCYGSSMTLTRVTFTGNWSAGAAGGAWFVAAGCNAALVDVTFAGNSADEKGGAVRVQNYPTVTMTNVTFWDNTAVSGGGVSCANASLDMSNATFYGNSATQGGGVQCSDNAMMTVTNSIVSFSAIGEGIYEYGSGIEVTILCSDVYGNAGGNYGGDIADQTGLNGNISEDPLFCSAATADFTIDATSPCAPDNNDCQVLMGAHGIGCNSPVESRSWGAIKAMFR